MTADNVAVQIIVKRSNARETKQSFEHADPIAAIDRGIGYLEKIKEKYL